MRVFEGSKKAPETKKYIILDRDGTIIRLVHHLKDAEQVEIIPGVADALGELKSLGFRFGIISNQSVIGRGKANTFEVEEVNRKITDYFDKLSIEFDFFLFCPHKPEDECLCRKPKTLLGEIVMEKFSIDPSKSFMIGDAISDIEFGNRLGLKSILISDEAPISDSYPIAIWVQDMMSAYLEIKGEEVKKIHE